MRKLAIASLLAALVVSLAGCHLGSELSHYFADFDDFIRGDKAEAAPTQDEGATTTYTLTVVCLNQKSITATIDSDDPDLLAAPVDLHLDARPSYNNSFAQVANLHGGAYTLTVNIGEGAGIDFTFQFDPSQTPTLLVVIAKTAESAWDVRVIPLASALAPVS